MTREVNEMQQAVSRTLRDSLGKLQRASDELNQAVNDLVAACASTRPANALSPMLRAQTSAAALAASLEVLSRFVTAALQAGAPIAVASGAQAVAEPVAIPAESAAREAQPASAEPSAPEPVYVAATPLPPGSSESARQEPLQDASVAFLPVAPEASFVDAPVATPLGSEATVEVAAQAASQVVTQAEPESTYAAPLEHLVLPVAETVAPVQASEVLEDSGAAGHPVDSSIDVVDLQKALRGQIQEKIQETVQEVLQAFHQPAPPSEPPPIATPGFDLSVLPVDEQELHRRASRVAKVSMQDIKMLRPNDVVLGKEQKDLCWRLRDDLEKAHKEYDRRFQSILGHPVDYFYDWLVEILADGDPKLLGEYPYPSPVVRH